MENFDRRNVGSMRKVKNIVVMLNIRKNFCRKQAMTDVNRVCRNKAQLFANFQLPRVTNFIRRFLFKLF